MKTDPVRQIARFGYGSRPDSNLSSLADAEFSRRLVRDLDPPPPDALALPTASDGLAALRAQREMRRAGAPPNSPETPHPVHAILLADQQDTMRRLIEADLGFRERLTTFWANHFTVSTRQGGCGALAGSFRREAIAPYVTGRFGDMLLAVMRHPAMLRYLDNENSIGPASVAAQRSPGRGLNENLARESLELHTVSPASGYSQADVTSYAAILTGWSVQQATLPYGFHFRPRAHQPGDKMLLGQRVPEGEQGGIEAIAFLASHPATHRHLATKLVRHFGADRPPPAEVATIEAALRDSDGDLLAASILLLGLPSAHHGPAKLRDPTDHVVASFRALGLPAGPHPDAAGLAGFLGQPLWGAPLPNGWPDTEQDWLGSEAMLRRVDLAWTLAGHASNDLDPAALAGELLGSMLRPDTGRAIAHAGSRREAVALLLASPEFGRR